MFCVADHFEPLEVLRRDGGPGKPLEHVGDWERRLRLVEEWASMYPEATRGLKDGDGCSPRHTFFCAPDDYENSYLEKIAELCADGFGEVEIHLHHRGDTPEGLGAKLCAFRDELRRRHGLLGNWRREASPGLVLGGGGGFGCHAGSIAYGFVHGNWALCNSRPDRDWCGVNEELRVLAATGCYADFTFPSAPSPTQPRMVNCIYRAWDRPCGRGAEKGSRCRVGTAGNTRPAAADPAYPLMIVQGPLSLLWKRRKWGILPRLDNGAITHFNPPTPERVDAWVRQQIHIKGRPEWVFVKVHAHGAIPSTSRIFLRGAMRRAWEYLLTSYNDGERWRVHFVTAREMYNIIRAAEDGRGGDPAQYRDYQITPCPRSL